MRVLANTNSGITNSCSPQVTVVHKGVNLQKNFKFHFVKYSKTNDILQKYCWRGFIWMITPQDFVYRLEIHVFTIDPGSERVKVTVIYSTEMCRKIVLWIIYAYKRDEEQIPIGLMHDDGRHQLKIHHQALFVRNSLQAFVKFALFFSGYSFQLCSF